MMIIAKNYDYTLRMGDDCTLYVDDTATGKRLFESNPNNSIDTIAWHFYKFTRNSVPADLYADIVLALNKVEGFAGGIHPDTVARFNSMLDAPSWKLLGWLR